jgi:hypothetical protein
MIAETTQSRSSHHPTSDKLPKVNERQQAHIDFYLERLGYWKSHRPHNSTARLLAARDADGAHPPRTEEEATEVVEYLWRLEREQNAGA